MQQPIYLFCDPLAKTDKVIIENEIVDELLCAMREECQTIADYEEYTAIVRDLDAGKRMHLNNDHTYIQRLFTITHTMLKNRQKQENE